MAIRGGAATRRSYPEVRGLLLERARDGRNPFFLTRFDEVAGVLARLDSVDPEPWAAAFAEVSQRHLASAEEAEAAGDAEAARAAFLAAYDYLHVARYPGPTSPAKMAAYRHAREVYLRAARYFDPPLEVVEIPFRGRSGEGDRIVGHLRRPRGVARPPVVVSWGGIDSFKEERSADAYLPAGLAVLSVDMPGAGEAPLKGSLDAERMWDPILDWLETRADLDGRRVAMVGASTGAYWATKLAHVRRDRLRAVVNHGGPAHFAFEAEWITRAQRGEYPFELAETLAFCFGLSGYEGWIEFAPRLSLARMGVLDQPCAPMLCVNGLEDTVFPIQDMLLLLEHGDPKTARFFPGGHMGHTPETQPLITRWVAERLS
jgi:pimeloyl-ACP methyl ester carboxylesterase